MSFVGYAIHRFLSTPSARRATDAMDGIKFTTEFLSTPSARRATQQEKEKAETDAEFLSTPSARRATQNIVREELEEVISIHALREEGDPIQADVTVAADHFYPRPPRGGRRSYSKKHGQQHKDFYPRPPRGGRQRIKIDPDDGEKISIHALREEGDGEDAYTLVKEDEFLSTPSARRATKVKDEGATE